MLRLLKQVNVSLVVMLNFMEFIEHQIFHGISVLGKHIAGSLHIILLLVKLG
jgi:hypothetical protein